MPKLMWNSAGQRFFELGVDRGVFYPEVGPGVAWNGLISVEESPSGGEARPFYIDGYKYLNLSAVEEYEATIQAYSPPSGFEAYEGEAQLHAGLFAMHQRRKSFDFSYRTRVGNDVDQEQDYKIHLVYNALAAPQSRVYSTLGSDVSPTVHSWSVTTKPLMVPGMRPTSHIVVDSRKANKASLALLEHILYGSDAKAPRMPTATELLSIFGWNVESLVNFTRILTDQNLTADEITNLATNPSFESATSGATLFRTNRYPRPTGIVHRTAYVSVSPSPVTVSLSASGGARLTYDQAGVTSRMGLRFDGASESGPEVRTVSIEVFVPLENGWNGNGSWILRDDPNNDSLAATIVSQSSVFVPGQRTRVSVTFIPKAGRTVTSIYYTPATPPSFGQWWETNNVLIEASTTANPYFDGSFGTRDGVLYEWTGLANDSTSTAKASLVEVRRNRVLNPSAEVDTSGWLAIRASLGRSTTRAKYGIASFELTAADSSAQQYLASSSTSSDRFPVTGGETVPVLASVWLESNRNVGFQLYEYDSGGNLLSPIPLSSPVPVVAGQWVDLSASMTVKAAAATVRVIVILDTPIPVGEKFWVDGIALGTPDYFDGSTVAGGDFTYAWTGTPNQSPSVQRAVSLVGVNTGANLVSVRSTQWASTGERSLRSIPNTSSNVSYSDMTALPVTAGKTYTLFTRIRLAAPQTGALFSNPRCISARLFPGTTQLLGASAPNEVGVHELRMIVQVPAGATSLLPRLLNGASAGNGEVWWDDLMVVEGAYTGDYFDGSNPIPHKNQLCETEWNGPVNESTSTLYYYDFLDQTGSEGDAHIINDEVWFWDSEEEYWRNAGAVPVS